MRTIHLDQLVISPNRQRKEFDETALQDTADSIHQHGLFHPPVLRQLPDGQLQLVAGERRCRIIRDMGDLGIALYYDMELIPPYHIPYSLLGELDELAAEEAELDENIRRADLTWQERATATARLMALRQKQAAARMESAPTTADIAKEVRGSSLGSAQEETRREIILAKHLDNPAVSQAKNTKEAWKALKREEDTKRNADLAASVGVTFSAKLHRAYNEDSLEWMKGADSEQFDVILTDPPYGMGADEFGDSGGKAAGEHSYNDTIENWMMITDVLCEESYRLAKPQAHAYIFCDIEHFYELREKMYDVGWKVFRTPLIWHKPSAYRAPWPEQGPQRKYECILYAVKGDKPCVKLRGDVLTYEPDTNLGHQAQKPVPLFIDLLSRSVHPGDAIFDPFCGSGPIFPAAHEFQCSATGIEIDPAHYGKCITRIETLHVSL